MTVECGFGGQKFQEHVLDKVRQRGVCALMAILLKHARRLQMPDVEQPAVCTFRQLSA